METQSNVCRARTLDAARQSVKCLADRTRELEGECNFSRPCKMGREKHHQRMPPITLHPHMPPQEKHLQRMPAITLHPHMPPHRTSCDVRRQCCWMSIDVFLGRHSRRPHRHSVLPTAINQLWVFVLGLVEETCPRPVQGDVPSAWSRRRGLGLAKGTSPRPG